MMHSSHSAARKNIFRWLIILSIFLIGQTVFFPISFAGVDSSESPGKAEKIQWLKVNGIPIRSVDPGDGDFSDLMPLVDKIGSARVVLLGEQSHGDGNVFLLKCRLVCFLHQVMGFDVLAWESGFYDCERMEAALHADIPLEDAIARGIFAIWGKSEQVQPVFQYARSTYGKPRPLIMTGFDCQLSARKSTETFSADLRRFLERANLEKKKGSQIWDHIFDAGKAWKIKEMTPAQRSQHKEKIDKIIRLVEEAKPELEKVHSPREIAFWERVLLNYRVNFALMEKYVTRKKNEKDITGGNMRDKAMAETFLWLKEKIYPNRKIIVWAATFHNMRRIYEVTTNLPDLNYEGFVTMGHPLYEKLGNTLYSIGFTAFQGKAGNVFMKKTWDIEPAKQGSLEELLHQTGEKLMFVDFRGPGNDPGHWLNRPLKSRPLGHASMDAIWTRHLDAMIFTDTLTPSTRIKKESQEK